MATSGKPRYACAACGAFAQAWTSQCSACGAWNKIQITSMLIRDPDLPALAAVEMVRSGHAPLSSIGPVAVARALQPQGLVAHAFARSVPIALTDVDVRATPKISTSIKSLDRVLGGVDHPGMTPASIVLLTADAGAGKSSLLGQVAAAMGRDLATLYVSGEETAEQVASRAIRINACEAHVRFVQEHDVDQILAHVDTLGIRMLIVDSMQTVSKAGMLAGTDHTIRTCIKQIVEHCKSRGISVWIIGHVTKDGGSAGPKTLEHMVDVTIHMTLDEDFRAFRAIRVTGKNRFGPGAGGEIGHFRMTETGLVDLDDEELAEVERKIAERDNGEGEDPTPWEPLARDLLQRAEAAGVDVSDLRERFAGLI